MTVVPQSCPPPELGLTGHQWAPLLCLYAQSSYSRAHSCPFMPTYWYPRAKGTTVVTNRTSAGAAWA